MPEPQAPAEKELKVKIPNRLHIELHSRKILKGETLHDTVTAALDAYFREHVVPTFDEAIPEDS